MYSASGLITGLKEYVYRGIQQLPIVLASTSLLLTVTTGSIAHANLLFGFAIVIPLYTFFIQSLVAFLMPLLGQADNIFWKRSVGDTCDLVSAPKSSSLQLLSFIENSQGTIPSFWLTSIAFFLGYAYFNIKDCLDKEPPDGASEVSIERRKNQAMFIAINTTVLFFIILGTRGWFMKGCDGLGATGVAFSYIFALGAFYIGYSVYEISKQCGARSTDLFGVLSQLIPESSRSTNPVVCKAE